MKLSQEAIEAGARAYCPYKIHPCPRWACKHCHDIAAEILTAALPHLIPGEQSREREAATAAHTPGPWEFLSDSKGQGEHGRIYWAIRTPQPNGATGIFVNCRLDHSAGLPPDSECEANARLIAAAPDMLAALQGAMVIIETCGWPDAASTGLRAEFDKRHEAIRAAIAKATAATTPAMSGEE